MNVRFSSNSVRIRIERGEFENLSRGAEIREVVEFPDQTSLTFALAPAREARGALAFQRDGNVFRFPVSADALKTIGENLGSRDAQVSEKFLQPSGAKLEVLLEVDVFTGGRR